MKEVVETAQKLLQLWEQFRKGNPYEMGRFIAGVLLWVALSGIFLWGLTFVFDEIESKYVYAIGVMSIGFVLALVIFAEAHYWAGLRKHGVTQKAEINIQTIPDPFSFSRGFMSAYSIYAEAFKGQAKYIGKGVKNGITFNVYRIGDVAFIIPYSDFASNETDKVARIIQDFLVNASLRENLTLFCREFFEHFS